MNLLRQSYVDAEKGIKKYQELKGRDFIKYFIILMVSSFIVQLPVYWSHPDSDIAEGIVRYPDLFIILLNSFVGSFFLAIVHRELLIVDEDYDK